MLGKNGAGKSTLLRLAAGRLPVAAGEIELFGRPGVRPARGQVAYLPQESELDPEMTPRETLELIAALLGLAGRERRIAEVVELFGLGPHLAKPVAKLSGGWRRRLDLALFFLEEARLLLLDEPAAGLDAEGDEILFAALEARAAAGAAVLLAGHGVERLARFARRALYFTDGRLAGEGPPESFAREAATAELPRRPGSGPVSGRGSGGGRRRV